MSVHVGVGEVGVYKKYILVRAQPLLPNHLDMFLNGSEDDLDVTRTSHGDTHSKMHTQEYIGEYREGSMGSQPLMKLVHRWYIVLAEYIWHIVQEHE